MSSLEEMDRQIASLIIGVLLSITGWASVIVLSWMLILNVELRDWVAGALWVLFLLLAGSATASISPRKREKQ